MATHQVFNNNTPLSERRVFEANDDHPVPLGTAPPALRTILNTDLAIVDESVVAGSIDIVVAGVALKTVETCC